MGKRTITQLHKSEQNEPKKRKEFVAISNGDQELMEDDDDSDDEQTLQGRKSLLKNHNSTVSQNDTESATVKNKQRVLLVSSRGITYRYRHLMQDIHNLLPHSKKDAKLDSKAHLEDLNEIAELNNCNNCLYFEVRKHQDMYLWMSKTPNGPSAKFMVRNVHTMDELNMTGNCLKGSRPVLSFDGAFDGEAHLQLLKEMFTQTFGTPRTSRKIKPFIDHVMSFSVVDNKIWIRNFQIIEDSLADKEVERQEAKESKKKAKKSTGDKPISLVEIGPRFVLEIMRIFDGSFGGSTLYENSEFVTPNNYRRQLKGQSAIKHHKRQNDKAQRDIKIKENQIEKDPLSDVFH